MPTRPALIRLGGTIRDADLLALREAAERDEASLMPDDINPTLAQLRVAIQRGGPIVFVNPVSSTGALPALEATARRLGISFRRTQCTRLDEHGNGVSWSPELGREEWSTEPSVNQRCRRWCSR